MTKKAQHYNSVLRVRLRAATMALAGIIIAACGGLAQAQTYGVIYNFAGAPADGASPIGTLVMDNAGNLYGTTASGGAAFSGTVFRVDPTGKERVLYYFGFPSTDGHTPYAGLVLDSVGNLYGTTAGGGTVVGAGTVFKLDRFGSMKQLYSFTGNPDGASPYCMLLRDAAGNLYGTTANGGTYSYGTVFKLGTDKKETVLYSFAGGTDGAYPYSGLVQDSAGNLYGTTSSGGAYNSGTVFELTKTGQEIVLYTFTGGADGASPQFESLVRDSAGNLYGTTYFGGDLSCNSGTGCGVVFKLNPAGSETVLYTFTGGTDGAYPLSGLLRDSSGDLYGTASFGGAYNYGTVFKLDSVGTETVLHSFAGERGGAYPNGGLIRDSAGAFYGTAESGGPTNSGVVFKLKP